MKFTRSRPSNVRQQQLIHVGHERGNLRNRVGHAAHATITLAGQPFVPIQFFPDILASLGSRICLFYMDCSGRVFNMVTTHESLHFSARTGLALSKKLCKSIQCTGRALVI